MNLLATLAQTPSYSLPTGRLDFVHHSLRRGRQECNPSYSLPMDWLDVVRLSLWQGQQECNVMGEGGLMAGPSSPPLIASIGS